MLALHIYICIHLFRKKKYLDRHIFMSHPLSNTYSDVKKDSE